MNASTKRPSRPPAALSELSELLDQAERHAGETCRLLNEATPKAYQGCRVPLRRCLQAVQKLADAARLESSSRGAGWDAAVRNRAMRLRGQVRRLILLHQQAAGFYLRRLEALAVECGGYGPQGWPAPPPRVRVEA